MKQHERVIEAMTDLGGYATFGQLYQYVDISGWKTKTPYASIRRIAQNKKFFFNIRPGLWALQTHKNKLPDHIYSRKHSGDKQSSEYGHSYYQGLLLEIGNLSNYDTFVPRQDKNKKFLDKTLGEVGTMTDVYQFSYQDFVTHVKNIDVSWFNSRKMPKCLFEIEHSTSMYNALIKFNELMDFNIRCFIVANEARKREFNDKMKLETFKQLKNKVAFYNYENLSKWHENCFRNDAVAAL